MASTRRPRTRIRHISVGEAHLIRGSGDSEHYGRATTRDMSWLIRPLRIPTDQPYYGAGKRRSYGALSDISLAGYQHGHTSPCPLHITLNTD